MFKDLSEYYAQETGQNLFEDETKTYFDPFSGFGNFFVVLFPLLDKHLQKKIPDQFRRIQHIFTNMLFFGEINQESASVI